MSITTIAIIAIAAIIVISLIIKAAVSVMKKITGFCFKIVTKLLPLAIGGVVLTLVLTNLNI